MKLLVAIAVLVLGIIGSASLFTVNETEMAILFKWGKIQRSDYQPGLHFQIPFVNNVRKFDKRIQTFDAKPEDYLTEEKKILVVDSFIQWRIENVKEFYVSMRGDMDIAQERIATIVKEGLRNEFGKRNMYEVISGERHVIMDDINKSANKDVKSFGVRIVDVRIKRIEFPPKVSDKIFRRMETERTRIAKELRAQGNESANKITAEADRQVTILKADAFKEAEKIRGEGDAKAADIYAVAYGKNSEFFSFYRSLNAYQNAFGSASDIMVVEPDSNFFDYFKNNQGK
ncbi:MAG: protease modulator HflC [gamma proteobacterium symbiont of Bathyaustriella thionipta]|nr:protease modulator HflC [gamma proteobacterium symbiont of Bathyaustriella thionipta]MCU7948800.1 protease modulator HflC [gamma proteobacterium symbiont of Bathyaustriella thionipta]MCU7954212.1 protease modulator HflC [gamma proteobacterium symbiont of Bathyaustriella thionipta]MCU7955258.1 protease modulator HflC [gamma proteobacterium symbiont of Bathyaustriella thionipta]MCU7966267.1 protease modulator HflC [gamma proteobacterium symbiont of Bathyaustriella thionipta]